MQLHCPLCCDHRISDYSYDEQRKYLRCANCNLVSVPEVHHLDSEAEKAIYDLHQNCPDDPGYREFLGRLVEPLVKKLTPGSRGLDFGSGPGPTLSVMFEERGFSMRIYDKFYAADSEVLTHPYDFITATEVVEHLEKPGAVLNQLWGLLGPGGCLGIMTQTLPDSVEAFGNWYYKKDPSHICFFSAQCFRWLADEWGADLTLYPNIAIFIKA